MRGEERGCKHTKLVQQIGAEKLSLYLRVKSNLPDELEASAILDEFYSRRDAIEEIDACRAVPSITEEDLTRIMLEGLPR